MNTLSIMKNILTIVLIAMALNAQAQKKRNVYTLDINEKLTTSKEDIAFYRIIEEPDSGSRYFKMTEFYPNKQIKRIVNLYSFEPFIVFGEGSVVNYYPDGRMKSSENFSHTSLYKNAFYYYPNGKHKTTLNYFYKNYELNYNTIQVSDTTGKDFLDSESNGTILIRDFDGIETKGSYKKGFKIGIWTYENKKDGSIVTEVFVNGKLKNGLNKTPEGITLNYKYLKTKPSLKSGVENDLTKRLNDNILVLLSKRLDKRGVVRIRFDLNDLGKPQNFEIVKSLSTASDQKAINLTKNKKWYPATFRGKPISTYNMIIDVKF
jgi:antitoxin component YwqK of YwqJK toxin-antitoxin module